MFTAFKSYKPPKNTTATVVKGGALGLSMTDSHEKFDIFEWCFLESLFYSKSLRAHCTEVKTVKIVKIGCLGKKLCALEVDYMQSL